MPPVVVPQTYPSPLLSWPDASASGGMTQTRRCISRNSRSGKSCGWDGRALCVGRPSTFACLLFAPCVLVRCCWATRFCLRTGPQDLSDDEKPLGYRADELERKQKRQQAQLKRAAAEPRSKPGTKQGGGKQPGGLLTGSSVAVAIQPAPRQRREAAAGVAAAVQAVAAVHAATAADGEHERAGKAQGVKCRSSRTAPACSSFKMPVLPGVQHPRTRSRLRHASIIVVKSLRTRMMRTRLQRRLRTTC